MIVDLESPNSVIMKGSFLLKQSNDQFENLFNQIKRGSKGIKSNSATNHAGSVLGVSLGHSEQNMQRQAGKRPAARDGHTGVVWQDNFIVFGGDRHHMPFNDLFMLDM